MLKNLHDLSLDLQAKNLIGLDGRSNKDDHGCLARGEQNNSRFRGEIMLTIL